METKLISSIPVVDHEGCASPFPECVDNLIGVFQRTDLIKLDFKDMSIFDCPINTFVSSVGFSIPCNPQFQPFSSKLIINANESLSRLFFTFAQYNTTSLICVNDENKPCGIASIVDLFFFFLKGDFALPAHPSAPPSVREASSPVRRASRSGYACRGLPGTPQSRRLSEKSVRSSRRSGRYVRC